SPDHPITRSCIICSWPLSPWPASTAGLSCDNRVAALRAHDGRGPRRSPRPQWPRGIGDQMAGLWPESAARSASAACPATAAGSARFPYGNHRDWRRRSSAPARGCRSQARGPWRHRRRRNRESPHFLWPRVCDSCQTRLAGEPADRRDCHVRHAASSPCLLAEALLRPPPRSPPFPQSHPPDLREAAHARDRLDDAYLRREYLLVRWSFPYQLHLVFGLESFSRIFVQQLVKQLRYVRHGGDGVLVVHARGADDRQRSAPLAPPPPPPPHPHEGA